MTSRGERWAIALILALALLVRLPFIVSRFEQSVDLSIFIRWIQLSRERGLASMYVGTDVDYPPLAIYLLVAVGWLESVLPDFARRGDAGLAVLFKCVAALADMGIAVLIALALRGAPAKRRIAACAAYALNPAIWYVSAYWAQLDTIYALCLVAAALLLSRGRTIPAWLAFALALATKPQAVALAPLLAVTTLRRHGARSLSAGIAIAAVTLLVMSGPWLAASQLESLMKGIARVEPRIDISGYNLWYLLLGGNVNGVSSALHPLGLPLSYAQWAFLLFAGSSVLVSALLWRERARSLALGAALLTLGLFMFAPGVHERFLFPVLPFAVLAAARWDARQGAAQPAGNVAWLLCVLLTLTFWFNLATIASFAPAWWTNVVATQPPYSASMIVIKGIAMITAAMNTVIWVWLLLTLARQTAPPSIERPQ